MKKLALRSYAAAAALVAFTGFASPASAQDAGSWQVKVLGSAVLPDGKIDKVDLDLVGLPAGTQTKANDNYVPTVAIEYFFSPAVSLETICCVTQHDVDATTGLAAGSELVSNAKLIPATFTLKYHLNPGGVSPYIGAGPTYFLWIDANPGAFAKAAGADKTTMSDELGFALQAGLDVPVNAKGMVVSLDAKRYFVGTTARWYAGGTKVIQTKHQLDPWVLSAGVGFRF
ncbi:OmpW/AlkL family protein [Croceibacterium aestuarii]|uniref:OmpW/AlkL family protein n=1 Tax=Croceibacterium aestuarii TaxID=3064139 RepID=UPI00272E5D8E|nr:OmpW family outer membrane protein [Croceibacterium sp. D39]